MLQELSNDGNVQWRCPCGRVNVAHVSHAQVEHPAREEIESHLEGTFVDEAGITHLKIAMVKTGVILVKEDTIALPPCVCGTRTFLKVVFTSEELHEISQRADSTTETHEATDDSIRSARFQLGLNEHMQRLGKAPDNLRKVARV